MVLYILEPGESFSRMVELPSDIVPRIYRLVKEATVERTGQKIVLTLADRRRVRAKLYLAEIVAEGRKGPVLVAEFNMPTPLLGVFALETLGLRPNP